MTVIRPSGSNNRQGPSRPVSRGEAVFGDIVVGLIATTVGVFLAVVLCGLIAMSVANAIGYVAQETGLLQAWEALVAVGDAGPLTPETFAALIWNNLMFGAAAGAVLGLVQFVRRWRSDRHRKLVETVISPSSLAALSYGATCLALHVAIGLLAAWAAGALFGVFLPSPGALLSGHDAALVLAHMSGDFGGGGFGGGAGETIIGLLFLMIFLLLVVALVVCSLFAFSGWACFRLASASAVEHIANEGAADAVTSGLGARGVALLLRCAVTRHGTGRNDGIDEDDLQNTGKLGFHTVVSAAIGGALHTLIYAAVLFTVPALFGIAVIAE